MKIERIVIVFVCLLAFLSVPVMGRLNPSKVYCQNLGYGYVVEQTDMGEKGVCKLPDSVSCEAWDFLKGKCGQEYSYCTKRGYKIKTVSDPDKCDSIMDMDCGVCVLEDGSEVEITELMDLNTKEGVCGDGKCVLGETHEICPGDCPSGSLDGFCDAIIDGKCDPDCMGNEDSDCGSVTTTLIPEETTTRVPITTLPPESTTEPSETTIPPETTLPVVGPTTSVPESLCGNGKCDQSESADSCPQDCQKTGGPQDYLPYIVLIIVLLVIAAILKKKLDEKKVEKEKEDFEKWKQEKGGTGL